MTWIPAILVLWLTGATLAWQYLPMHRRDGDLALVLGTGYLAGCLLAGLAVPLTFIVVGSLKPIYLVAVHSTLFVLLLLPTGLECSWVASKKQRRVHFPRLTRSRETVGFVAILVIVVAELLLLWGEAVTKPLLGWDAWQAWAAKAKVWINTGQLHSFSGWHELSQAPFPGGYYGGTTHPELLPWLLTWFMSMQEMWKEALIGHLYISLLCAIGLVIYGGLRQVGSTRIIAAISTWIALSLPYVAVHVALPGYADLWLAAFTLVAAVMLAIAWSEACMRTALPVIVLAGLSSALVKSPGAIWACIILAVTACAVSPRLRWLLYAGLVLVIGLITSGLITTIWLPMSQSWWTIEPTDVTAPLSALLVAARDWNVLWWLVAGAAAMRIVPCRANPGFHPLETYLLFGGAFLAVAFYFSTKSVMVIDHTAVTRSMLPLALPAVFWLGIVADSLWRSDVQSGVPDSLGARRNLI